MTTTTMERAEKTGETQKGADSNFQCHPTTESINEAVSQRCP
jgi:hypothetical protein